jgi:hypothetical protein
MADLADAVSEAVEKHSEGKDDAEASRLNTIVAAGVAIAATFMALCSVKDGNVCQAMQQAQTQSVDAWAYYQAKGTKQNLAEQTVDQLTIQRDLAGSNATADAKTLLDKKIADYTEKAKKYETEKDDIKTKAEGFEKDYEALNVHDDQFDMAEATISIGIALFGVTALTRKKWLLVVGFVFGGFGTLLGLAGFIGWSFHPDFLMKLLG